VTTHVSRAGWDARPPESTTPLTRSRIDKFIVHYSGASRLQTVRSIQNFCMDVKDHVDIDYNRIVRGTFDYMGRGWNVGGHTLNNNSTSYGVCVIGVDGDATDDDFRTVREIYDEVCTTLGRQITKTTHRGVLGTSYTDCPGNELHNWVMAGMPYPSGGTDMAGPLDEPVNQEYVIRRLEALALAFDKFGASDDPSYVEEGLDVPLVKLLKQTRDEVLNLKQLLAGGVTLPTSVDLSPEALDAIDERVRAIFGDAGQK
jgi:hypothetical protein